MTVAYGLITGIISYIILNVSAWLLAKASAGRIVPHDYDQADYWTYKVRGGLLPGWVKRLARGKKDFWRDWNFETEELGSHDSYVPKDQFRFSGNSIVMATPPGGVTPDLAGSWPMTDDGMGTKTSISVGGGEMARRYG